MPGRSDVLSYRLRHVSQFSVNTALTGGVTVAESPLDDARYERINASVDISVTYTVSVKITDLHAGTSLAALRDLAYRAYLDAQDRNWYRQFENRSNIDAIRLPEIVLGRILIHEPDQ